MARLSDKNLVRIPIRISMEERKSLEHHARRLGADMAQIIRSSMAEKLELLDEREKAAAEVKRLKEKKGAYVPVVGESRFGKAPGLGDKNREAPPTTAPAPTAFPTAKPKVPDKIVRSFKKFAEYLEAATDKTDSEERVAAIIEEIEDRTTTKEEAAASFDALQEFVKTRADAKRKVDVTTVEGEVEISGDVE